MKNVFKSFALILTISLVAISCTENVDLTDSQDEKLIQPLEDNHKMDNIVIADENKITTEFEMPEVQIQTRSNCPAFDYAQSQYLAVNSNCNYSFLYCEYLKLFWQIEFHIAAINCGWSIYCQPTCGAFQIYANGKLIDLTNLGLHPVYIQSLGQRIFDHDALCDNC